MGGKKTVGAHPTRGHYHNTVSSGRPHAQTGDTVAEIPFTQEFSLFCADVIPDTAASPSIPPATGGMFPPLRTDHPSATMHPSPFGQWYHTPDSTWGDLQGGRAQISELETQLESLRKSVHELEISVGSGDTGTDTSSKKKLTGKQASDMKRLTELLKTVEGRQKSIQSKISHLDSVFGPSAAAWAQGAERLRYMMEYFDMMRCCPPLGDAPFTPYGYSPHPPMPPFYSPIPGYANGPQLNRPSYSYGPPGVSAEKQVPLVGAINPVPVNGDMLSSAPTVKPDDAESTDKDSVALESCKDERADHRPSSEGERADDGNEDAN